LPVSQWKSARTTDEIDKHFSARLPAGFGTVLSGGPCSSFCPSKAR
jgi:hypothetical protein